MPAPTPLTTSPSPRSGICQVYPVGIPLSYFVLLYRNRQRVNPPGLEVAQALERRQRDKDIRQLEFLFRQYTPKCW
jgi:hypothetical protein